MWKLNTISAKNLCAFKELHYSIRQGVTTLVFGDNRDNESQRSNGSGKSALLECVALGITGSPLRRIRNEEIIRDTADECHIELSFTNTSTNERLDIRRHILRREPSWVVCDLYHEGIFDTTGEASQPTVDAYNRYILDKLGITRDELYNNFILSKYRYAEFLAASDKEKKEIINRFSNGVLVDAAIEKVDEDLSPLLEQQSAAALEVAGFDGRVEMLQEQILREQAEQQTKDSARSNRIVDLQNSLIQKQAEVLTLNSKIGQYDAECASLEQVEAELQQLENSDRPLDECRERITVLSQKHLDATPTDWKRVLEEKKYRIDITTAELRQAEAATRAAEREIDSISVEAEKTKNAHSTFLGQYEENTKTLSFNLQACDKSIQQLSEHTDALRRQQRALAVSIENLNKQLAGVVVCPSCGFEFTIASKEFDVAVGREKLTGLKQQSTNATLEIESTVQKSTATEQQQHEVRQQRRALECQYAEWEAQIINIERKLRASIHSAEAQQHKQQRLATEISTLQQEVDGIRRRLFDEVFGFIDDRHRRITREHRQTEEEVKALKSAIEALRETIEEAQKTTPSELIASLRATLREFRAKAAAALVRKESYDDQIRILEMQKQRFVQFKTYLANTKIAALASITNDFLAAIGSDIRIRFDGYTVLKSGKVREKISIALIRDGVDCGSFGKFSAGEAARVNLATILSMQRLVNTTCEDGKGLDLLVLDEILEAVDEAGLASMFEALNKLGITALIVSHGNIAEAYPHKLLIAKENGVSRIDN